LYLPPAPSCSWTLHAAAAPSIDQSGLDVASAAVSLWKSTSTSGAAHRLIGYPLRSTVACFGAAGADGALPNVLLDPQHRLAIGPRRCARQWEAESVALELSVRIDHCLDSGDGDLTALSRQLSDARLAAVETGIRVKRFEGEAVVAKAARWLASWQPPIYRRSSTFL